MKKKMMMRQTPSFLVAEEKAMEVYQPWKQAWLDHTSNTAKHSAIELLDERNAAIDVEQVGK